MTRFHSVLPGELAALEPTLADRYRFLREIGRGGCGIVFLADDLKRGNPVAVKVLRLELGGSRVEERFAREIDIVTKLRHPNIVPVIESGELGGTQYLVMPFIDGETLQQRLRRERQLSTTDATAIATQVADALAYAHRADVVHRDIKPANILLIQGRALVADFGIARAISRSAPVQWQSSSRVQVGTAEYMSPEQAAGGEEVDGRSDIYSLGCTFYEMLAGSPPFTAATQTAVLSRHALDPVPSLRTVRQGVPHDVERVIMRALAKAPADRYAAAEEFLTALARATTANQETPQPQGLARGPRSRRIARVAAVVAMVAVSISGLWYVRGRGRDAIGPKGFDPQLIAVAPFSVPDPDLAMWREGLVDVLSRTLDAAGPIRTVSPTVVLRRWSGRPDESSASGLGRRTGARYAVYGSLLRAGRDSIRASAVVYDVAKSKMIGEVEVKEVAERVDRLADRLTVEVLRELGQYGEAKLAEVRLAPAAGSSSLPALKAFLQAEHFFRRTAWDSALVYYHRAVELDPRHPLALFRLSLVTRWQSLNGDSISSAYALQADAANHALAPRESLMVHAGALFARMTIGFADTAYWRHRAELFSTLDVATQRYPDERELWYAIAESRYRADASARLALDAYDRAIAIDSGFAPAYPNAVIMAMALRGDTSAGRYLDGYLRLQPTDVHADGLRLAASILKASRARDSSGAKAILDTASAELLANAADALAYWPDSSAAAVSLLRLFAAGRHTAVRAYADTTFRSWLLAHNLAFRGKLAEAIDVLGIQPTMLARVPGSQYVRATAVATLMMLGAKSQAGAAEYFAHLSRAPVSRPTGLIIALPWWSEIRDTVSLQRVIVRAQSALTGSQTGVEGPYTRYFATSAKAYLALARSDTTSALNYLLGLPEPGCMYPYCPFERLVTARLLTARAEYTRAAAILDDVPNLYSPIAVLWRLERARVAERLGRNSVAAHEYKYVADAWANADSVFQPMTAAARSGLTRVTAAGSR